MVHGMNPESVSILAEARAKGQEIHVAARMVSVSKKGYEKRLQNGLSKLALCFVEMRRVTKTIKLLCLTNWPLLHRRVLEVSIL